MSKCPTYKLRRDAKEATQQWQLMGLKMDEVKTLTAHFLSLLVKFTQGFTVDHGSCPKHLWSAGLHCTLTFTWDDNKMARRGWWPKERKRDCHWDLLDSLAENTQTLGNPYNKAVSTVRFITTFPSASSSKHLFRPSSTSFTGGERRAAQ